MRKLMMFACTFTITFATACSKDETPSCEALFDHTKALAPVELRDRTRS